MKVTKKKIFILELDEDEKDTLLGIIRNPGCLVCSNCESFTKISDDTMHLLNKLGEHLRDSQ